jgi:predicted secreted protein
MNWVSGIVVYVVVWWLVIFCVLPFGVTASEEGHKGFAPSAPVNPRLGLKVLVTTAISAVIWLAIYLFIVSDIYSFRDGL